MLLACHSSVSLGVASLASRLMNTRIESFVAKKRAEDRLIRLPPYHRCAAKYLSYSLPVGIFQSHNPAIVARTIPAVNVPYVAGIIYSNCWFRRYHWVKKPRFLRCAECARKEYLVNMNNNATPR